MNIVIEITYPSSAHLKSIEDIVSTFDYCNGPVYKGKLQQHLQHAIELGQIYTGLVITARTRGKEMLAYYNRQLRDHQFKFSKAAEVSARTKAYSDFKTAMENCANAESIKAVAENQLNTCNAIAQAEYDRKIARSNQPGFKPTAGYFASANRALSDAKRACLAAYIAIPKPSPDEKAQAKEYCRNVASDAQGAALNYIKNNMDTLTLQWMNEAESTFPDISILRALRSLTPPMDPAYEAIVIEAEDKLKERVAYIEAISLATNCRLPGNFRRIKDPVRYIPIPPKNVPTR